VLVWNNEPSAVAAADSVDPDRWRAEFESAVGRISGRFARREPLAHARDLVVGLVSGLERKNCWTIAEHAGHASPHGLQHLLSRAVWDADAVRDDVRGYVLDHLGDPGAVLVLDETGDLKKGTGTVGVQRQYTGTAGRIENAQVAVYLTYAAPGGHAFIDRALYLPKSWCDDVDRRTRAGVPTDVSFATKPALAAAMIDRAVAAGTPAAWVGADDVYGGDG
jgi:SRSO17 transposase